VDILHEIVPNALERCILNVRARQKNNISWSLVYYISLSEWSFRAPATGKLETYMFPSKRKYRNQSSDVSWCPNQIQIRPLALVASILYTSLLLVVILLQLMQSPPLRSMKLLSRLAYDSLVKIKLIFGFAPRYCVEVFKKVLQLKLRQLLPVVFWRNWMVSCDLASRTYEGRRDQLAFEFITNSMSALWLRN